MDVPSGGEEVGGRTFRQDQESPLSPPEGSRSRTGRETDPRHSSNHEQGGPLKKQQRNLNPNTPIRPICSWWKELSDSS